MESNPTNKSEIRDTSNDLHELSLDDVRKAAAAEGVNLNDFYRVKTVSKIPAVPKEEVLSMTETATLALFAQKSRSKPHIQVRN